MEWEAWASTPRGGLPSPGRIVFRCLTDPTVRSRFRGVDGSRSLAERRIHAASDHELQELLEGAQELP